MTWKTSSSHIPDAGTIFTAESSSRFFILTPRTSSDSSCAWRLHKVMIFIMYCSVNTSVMFFQHKHFFPKYLPDRQNESIWNDVNNIKVVFLSPSSFWIFSQFFVWHATTVIILLTWMWRVHRFISRFWRFW